MKVKQGSRVGGFLETLPRVKSWLSITTDKFYAKFVYTTVYAVYDSMSTCEHMPYGLKKALENALGMQVRLRMAQCAVQSGVVDCGILAMTNMYAVLEGIQVPTKVNVKMARALLGKAMSLGRYPDLTEAFTPGNTERSDNALRRVLEQALDAPERSYNMDSSSVLVAGDC